MYRGSLARFDLGWVDAIVALALGFMLVFAGLSMRELNSVLSIFCIGGIIRRSIPYWKRMTWLERAFAVVTGIYLIIGAIGSYNLDRISAPPSGVIVFAIGLKFVILGLIIYWPLWVGTFGNTAQRLGVRK